MLDPNFAILIFALTIISITAITYKQKDIAALAIKVLSGDDSHSEDEPVQEEDNQSD